MENNIVQLHEDGKVYSHIKTFLNDLQSESTKVRYKRSIDLFFNWKYDLPLEHLKTHHINQLSYDDFKKFRAYLRRKKYAANTVNNTMNGLYSMLKEIRKIDPREYKDLYVEDLRLKPLKVTDGNHTGLITWSESEKIINYLRQQDTKKTPNKVAIVHMLRVTGIRKGNHKDGTGLLGTKYKDLRYENDMWVLYYRIKGKQSSMAIKDSDAQMLLDLREDATNDDELIFKLSGKTVERLMEDCLDKLGFDSNRDITPHSLRKLSAIEVYKATGNNIMRTASHLDHSNIDTTRLYVSEIEELENSPSLLVGEEFTQEKVEHLTKEQWQEMFTNMSRSNQWEVYNLMKKLGYSHSE